MSPSYVCRDLFLKLKESLPVSPFLKDFLVLELSVRGVCDMALEVLKCLRVRGRQTHHGELLSDALCWVFFCSYASDLQCVGVISAKTTEADVKFLVSQATRYPSRAFWLHIL